MKSDRKINQINTKRRTIYARARYWDTCPIQPQGCRYDIKDCVITLSYKEGLA